MIKRWIKKLVKESLAEMRATLLTGARQCGKTTLAKDMLPEKQSVFKTLDNKSLRAFAQNNPEQFLQTDKQTMIIDEIQKAPSLYDEIKIALDSDNRKGQYLITGSANIHNMAKVDSLAGRVREVRLRPFTYGEILNKNPAFLERIKNKDFAANADYDINSVLKIASVGGYPEAVADEKIRRGLSRKWYDSYVNVLIKRDLREISNIEHYDKLKDLLRIMCGYSGKYFEKKKNADKLGISLVTMGKYLNILENIYLFDFIPAWYKSGNKYAYKQRKLYACDSGLMAALLKLSDAENIALDGNLSGAVLETFAYNQIVSQAELNSDDETKLYHYRDWSGNREIDMILENGKEIICIEVKSASRAARDDLKHIKWFKDNINTNKKITGIVLNTGKEVFNWGNDMFTAPINNLWD